MAMGCSLAVGTYIQRGCASGSEDFTRQYVRQIPRGGGGGGGGWGGEGGAIKKNCPLDICP